MNKNIENYFNQQDVEESNRKLEYFINQDIGQEGIYKSQVEMQPHIQYSNI